jgi:hypothetical protein
MAGDRLPWAADELVVSSSRPVGGNLPGIGRGCRSPGPLGLGCEIRLGVGIGSGLGD